VPLNPLVLARLNWDFAVAPAGPVWLVGFAEMVKPGGPEATTVKVTGALWERLPLVPVTATL